MNDGKNINEKIRYFFSRYMYGLLVAVIVWIALILMPMFNTEGMIGFNIPDTTIGRIAYFTIRGLVAVLVFMIFVLFDMQGKSNVLDTPEYKEAFDLLNTVETKEYIPISPRKYRAKTYGMKAITLSITTAFTACIIMEMVLSYNWSLLASYALSILTACINGCIQMKKAEVYWTEEYLRWAKYIKKHEKEKQDDSIQQQGISQSTRTSTEK
jgi:hypothetical protein